VKLFGERSHFGGEGGIYFALVACGWSWQVTAAGSEEWLKNGKILQTDQMEVNPRHRRAQSGVDRGEEGNNRSSLGSNKRSDYPTAVLTHFGE